MSNYRTAFKGVFDRYGKKTIKEARSNLTRKDKNVSRGLYESLDYEVKFNPRSIEFRFTGNEYGAFKTRESRDGSLHAKHPTHHFNSSQK